jgi:hypothetical protein
MLIADMPPGLNWKRLLGTGATTLHAGEQGESTVMKFACPWTEAWAFIDAIKGEEETIGGQTARVPLENPEREGQYAYRVSGRGIGGKGIGAGAQYPDYPAAWENATFSFAELDVEFRTPEFNIGDGTVWGRRSLRISAEAITAPGSPYSFVGGGPLNQDVAKILPLIDVRFTRYWLTPAKLLDLEDLVEDILYKTNEEPFTLTGKTYPPETLLCAGLITNADFTGIGNVQTNAEISFLVKPTGWNFVPTWQTGGAFTEVTPPIYEPEDYDQFLTL